MENSHLQTPQMLDAPSIELMRSLSKWSRFVGIIFLIFSLTIVLTFILIFLNFDIILREISKVNGMNEEMLTILQNGGKSALLFFCFVSFSILFFNGYLLYHFGSKLSINCHEMNDQNLYSAFRDLNRYFQLSIVLSVISLLFTFLIMISQFFSMI
ncbi:MAG: hypothetical protein IT215_03950 [Chitinophagaceae bacterium]|nr:MAG: hypothetical protein UZ11_BCD004000456 [Bacteroidetes bacterium OLB11]MCC6447818.1 hypothetical protein [Chitinophagaceae bacterium]HMN31741.1 hypothetical protein [Chitinophagaceae bacterium]